MPDGGRGGQNGRGRGGNQVDRATWRLVTALTRQQARRGRQALFPPRLPLLLIPVESLQLLLPLLDRLDFLGGSFFNTFFVSFQDNIDGMFSDALTPFNEAFKIISKSDCVGADYSKTLSAKPVSRRMLGGRDFQSSGGQGDASSGLGEEEENVSVNDLVKNSYDLIKVQSIVFIFD